MESGFHHLGWREMLAVALATAIILDWAATRYLRAPRPRSEAGSKPHDDRARSARS